MSPGDPGRRRRSTPRARTVCAACAWKWSTAGAAPVRASWLDRWLAAVVPARIRGEVSVALVSDRRVRALNRDYRRATTPPTCSVFPSAASLPRVRPDGSFLGDIVIATGVARRQALAAGHSETDRGPDSRAARPVASDRLRSRAGRRRDGARRTPAQTEGWAARRPHRTGGASRRVRSRHRHDDSAADLPARARWRLPRRDRSGVQCADAPVAASGGRAQRPARLAYRISRRSGPAVRAGPSAARRWPMWPPPHCWRRCSGSTGAHRLALVIVVVAAFAIVFELFLPLLIVGRDPERWLELLLPTFNPIAKLLSPLTRWIARSVARIAARRCSRSGKRPPKRPMKRPPRSSRRRSRKGDRR